MARQRKMTSERRASIGSLLEYYKPSDVQDVQEIFQLLKNGKIVSQAFKVVGKNI